MNRDRSKFFLIIFKLSAWTVWLYFSIIELSGILVLIVKEEIYAFPTLPQIFMDFYYFFSVLFLIVELLIAFFLRHYMIIKPMEHGKIGNESAEGFLIVFIVSLVNWFIAYSISISGSVIYRLYDNIPMMILFIVIGFVVMMVNMPIIFKERNVFIKKFLYLFKPKQQQAKTSKVS